MSLLFSKWFIALYQLLPAIYLVFMFVYLIKFYCFYLFISVSFGSLPYFIIFIINLALDAFMVRSICDASVILSFTVSIMCSSACHKTATSSA
jgi:hypothetical protein